MKRSNLLAALAVALLPLSIANAQDFPTRPVRILVPFAPGGDSDVMARLVADKFPEKLGQPGVVENRPGGGGVVGWNALTQSQADGYTVIMFSSGNPTLPAFVKGFPENWYASGAPITLTQRGPLVLAVNSQVPARNLGELISYAKANPGKLNIGSPGGSVTLLAELLKSATGTNMVVVTYKGSSPAQIANLANEVQLTFESINSGKAHFASGKLRPIAVGTLQRTPLMPEVAAAAELVPGFEGTYWFAFAAPAGTPRAAIQRLHAAITSIIQLPDVKKRMTDGGTDVVGSSPEELGRVMESETKLWLKLARDAKIEPQ